MQGLLQLGILITFISQEKATHHVMQGHMGVHWVLETTEGGKGKQRP